MLRSVKNVVNNYTEAEVKVREATSNDPWGPSTTLLSEISSLTMNQVTFAEVMAMLWKRLGDHGKNWRHVIKSLTVLDYLCKNGPDRVVEQCKSNYYAIETLKNFSYIDAKTGKDEGKNVRIKAENLAKMLKDDEMLKEERKKAKQTRQRFEQAGHAVSSLNSYNPNAPSSSSTGPSRTRNQPSGSVDMERARPRNATEEDLQLQMALEMSKAEADQKNTSNHKEDLKMEMALKESLKAEEERKIVAPLPEFKKNEPNLLDLQDPWAQTTPAITTNSTMPAISQDPFNLGMPMAQSTGINNNNLFPNLPNPVPTSTNNDPWGNNVSPNSGLSNPGMTALPAAGQTNMSDNNNPWGAPAAQPMAQILPPSQIDPWGNNNSMNGNISNSVLAPVTNGTIPNGNMASDPFDPFGQALSGEIQDNNNNNLVKKEADLGTKFLGAGADLVNLDALAVAPINNRSASPNKNVVTNNVFAAAPMGNNPFTQVNQNTGNVFNTQSNVTSSNNPFAIASAGPSLNQIKAEQQPQPQPDLTLGINFPTTNMFPVTNQPNQNGSQNSAINSNANPFF